MPLPWKGIIVHHSLTADSRTVSWDAIGRYHTDPNGPSYYRMRAIGYHAGVEMIGDSYEALFGRPLDWYGAHAHGVNGTHLGVLFVGNFDLEPPPDEMLRVGCERIIRPWMKAFSIPIEKVEPHRKYAPKSCPGVFFAMDRLREILAGLPPADFS